MQDQQLKEIVAKLIRAASWNTAAGIFSRALLFAVTIIIARTLPREVYGAYAFILSTAYTIANIAGFGLNVCAAKLIVEDRIYSENQNNLVWAIELIAAMISAMSIILIFVLKEEIFSETPDPLLTRDLMLNSSLFVFLFTIGGVQNSIAIGLGLYKRMAVTNIFTSALSAFIQLSMIETYGVIGIIAGLTISQFVSFIIFTTMIRLTLRRTQPQTANPKFTYKTLINVIQRSAPVFMSGVAVTPVMWWMNYILVNQQNGFNEMATLSLASQWRVVILFIPEILVGMMLPQLTALFLQKKIKTFAKYAFWGAGLVGAISVIFSVIAIISSNYLTIIYGKAYIGGNAVFVEMAFACILIAINSVIGQVIVSTSYVWYGLIFNIAWATLLAAVSYVFIVILQLGAIGATHALLVAYSFHCIWQFTFIQIFLKKNRVNIN